MGRQHDVLHFDQGRINLRLVFIDIKARAGNHAVLQGAYQSIFVDDSASCSVNQHAVWLHGGKRMIIDKVLGLGCQRAVD